METTKATLVVQGVRSEETYEVKVEVLGQRNNAGDRVRVIWPDGTWRMVMVEDLRWSR